MWKLHRYHIINTVSFLAVMLLAPGKIKQDQLERQQTYAKEGAK